MMDAKPNGEVAGTDWTKLMADPVLAQNLGTLLQVYRDAPAEHKEETLLAAMRKIKQESGCSHTPTSRDAESPSVQADPAQPANVPPFETDLFSSNPILSNSAQDKYVPGKSMQDRQGEDRRRHPRMRCFVAVELRVDNADTPIWGNLSNTSLGGCQVETAGHVNSASKVEIGLWVASGKIWVKGLALDGVVTGRAAAGGVRIRFGTMDAAEKKSLREFLKYVQDTTDASQNENRYLELLKK